ncbi:BlaI/MecI/CopY family transcriptional regulator [Qiania dongpingensis]|uniref:BlaI/MecI/CopY family transcriptional regulator n=1 Tax=Qiania dongpingensis TaxID=2763669 RepID=A0A7G9G752_9FIRM|nr:BlaI/MecI/CopY family transcriptional regulator [Qiania dongpingensis]QNM06634.1 BlaI/MecI/CopY family transcriptional regulator [Qiania dongpingensis]
MAKARLTATELDLMRMIWEVEEDGQETSTSNIRKKYQEYLNEQVLPQTVNTYAGHLEKKGYIQILKSENGRRTHIPLVSKKDYMEEQTRYWRKFWNQSSAAYAMMALKGDEEGLSKEDLAEFRRFLDEFD